MTESIEITQQMFEHLQSQVRLELLPTSPKPVEDKPSTSDVGSPSVCLSQQRFEQSPRGRFLLTPRQGVGFTLGIERETSTLQIEVEGTSSKRPVLVEEEPTVVEEDPVPREEPTVVPRAEPEREDSHEDPVTPHPVGAKARPMTRSATKQGPPRKAPASSKWPTKTPG